MDSSKNVKGRSIDHTGYKECFKGCEKGYVAIKMVRNNYIKDAKLVALCKSHYLATKANDFLERPHALELHVKFCYKYFMTINAHNIIANHLGVTKTTRREDILQRNKVIFNPPKS